MPEVSAVASSSSYVPPKATKPADTPEEEKKKFDKSLREDAVEISEVELDGSKKLALLDSTLGSNIDTKA